MHVGAERLRHWPVAVLTAFDRLLNAIALGDDRMSISARTWHADQSGKAWGRWARPKIDGVFALFGQTDHCRHAAEFDAAVRQVMADRLAATQPEGDRA